MQIEQLVKSLCLALNIVASHTVLTPPNGTPQPNELAKYDDANVSRRWISDPMVVLAAPIKGVVISTSIAELCLLLASAMRPNHVLSRGLGDIVKHSPLTPMFLLGSFLLCSGAALRKACYRHLGRHFTFELALRKDHKLITTGPYAFVRHPSYTGSLMYMAGNTLVVFGDTGSLWVQLWRKVPWLACPVGVTIVAVAGIAMFLFLSRTKREDRVLRDEFGDEWVRWSRKTPYKLIPYIF